MPINTISGNKIYTTELENIKGDILTIYDSLDMNNHDILNVNNININTINNLPYISGPSTGNGDVIGPNTVTENSLTIFNGTSGNYIKEVSSLTVNENNGDTKVNTNNNLSFEYNNDAKLTINSNNISLNKGAVVDNGYNIVNPTEPTDGTHLTNMNYVDRKVGGIYVGISDGILITGNVENNLLPINHIGTLTANANSFKKGQAFHFVIAGDISTSNKDNITIKLKSNNNNILSYMTIPLTGTNNEHFEIELDWVIREDGGEGTADFVANWDFTYSDSGLSQFRGDRTTTTNNTTFDTTIDNTLSITAQFNSLSSNNRIQSRMAYLKKIIDISI